MSHTLSLSRDAFDELIREHQQLVHLTNELELRLYELGDRGPPSREQATACQQAAGDLIRQLRQTLFRLDQQVYPLLEPGVGIAARSDQGRFSSDGTIVDVGEEPGPPIDCRGA